jgi:hypothetical protein
MIATKWKWNEHKFNTKKFQNWDVGALVLWRAFDLTEISQTFCFENWQILMNESAFHFCGRWILITTVFHILKSTSVCVSVSSTLTHLDPLNSKPPNHRETISMDTHSRCVASSAARHHSHNVCKTPSVHQGTTSVLICPETIQKDPFMSTQLKNGGSAIRIQD